MSTTLCIDEHDRLSTPVHLQALHDPQRGSLVVHAVVDGKPADIAHAVLEGFGFTRSTPGWPGRTPRAMHLASDWVYGLEIHRIVIYGAWRLTDPSLDWLAALQRDQGTEVTLVTAARFPNTERLRHQANSEQTLQTLLQSTTAPEAPRQSTSRRWLYLENQVAPLPAAPMATFLAEVGAVLQDNRYDFLNVVATFERVVQWVRESLGSDPTHETFCRVLDDLLARARCVNDIIIQVRGAQAGALLSGLNVELDLQEICRIAYVRHHTSPDSHDWCTFMGLGVDPRLPAAAALAIATRSPITALAKVLLAEFDPDTNTITLDGSTITIPKHLAVAVRAQHRRQTRKGHDYLLGATAGEPAAHTLKRLLGSHAPRAAAATGRAATLLAYKAAIKCQPPHATPEDRSTESFIGLSTDSLDRWAEHLDCCASELTARYGLPTRPSSDRLNPYSVEDHRADALRTLSGITPDGLPASRPKARRVEDDVRILHSVILQYGGKIRRGDLYRALGWTAQRTQAALKQLQRSLEPLGETIADEPPDSITVRARDHPQADHALRILRARAQAREGLTTGAARILYQLLQAHPEPIAALPDDHPDASAQAELRQANIAELARGRLALDATVAMTLGHYTGKSAFKSRRDVG